MSILAQVGQAVTGSVLSKIFGTNNRSLQGDCLDISDVGSYAAKLAKYPQCAPYISAAGPLGVTSPVGIAPGAPATLPGGAVVTPPYTPALPSTMPALQNVSFAGPTTPAMTTMSAIPQIGTLAGAAGALGTVVRSAGALTAAARAALPTLNKALAIASGFIVAGSLVYDSAGRLIGKTRKRRRMNPLNYRAAKRAARRLCAVKDLCGQIERAIPSKPRRAARRSNPFRRKKSCR